MCSWDQMARLRWRVHADGQNVVMRYGEEQELRKLYITHDALVVPGSMLQTFLCVGPIQISDTGKNVVGLARLDGSPPEEQNKSAR